MFERLRLLYKKGRLDKKALDRAVALGWITEDEEQEILNE